MRDMRILFFVALLICLMVPASVFSNSNVPDIPEIPPFPDIQSNGETFHTDVVIGSDETGDGSSGDPWKTIQHGVSLLSAGNTLIVHAGTYNEELLINKAGTESNWITIKGAEGETVILTSSSSDCTLRIGDNENNNENNVATYLYLKNLKITISTFNGIVKITPGATNLAFDDIEIDGQSDNTSGMSIGENDAFPGVTDCYFRNIDVHHNSMHGVHMNNPFERLVFDSCRFHDNGNGNMGDGISGRSNREEENHCADVYFKNCEAYYNAEDGFDIGIKDGVNTFKNCVSKFNGHSGFKVWGSNVWLMSCIMHDNGYGSFIKPLWEGNIYILNSTLITDYKEGTIVAHATNGPGVVISPFNLYMYNNFIINTKEGGRAVQFYHEGAQIVESNNNYFFSHQSAAIAKAFQFRIYTGDEQSPYLHNGTYYLSDIGPNGVWNEDTGHGSCSIAKTEEDDGLQDPGFINLSEGNLHLTSDSLAIDTGTDVGITEDFDGTPVPLQAAPDIGAYEYINQYPIADADEDNSHHVGDVISLDGSQSSDPDGHYPLTYSWSIVSIPAGSNISLDNPDSVSPTFQSDQVGDYIFKLIVTDSLGLESAPDQVLISTSNTPPIADAGPEQSVITIGLTVYLDGSQSSDPDGDELTYQWTIVSKPGDSHSQLNDGSLESPSFTVDEYGEYIIQLLINDDYESSTPDTVKVSFDNIAPVASAGDNQSVLDGETVYLDGNSSSDVNGDSLTYNWNIVSGPDDSSATLDDPSSITPTFVTSVAGEYVVSLVVNDGLLYSEPDNIIIVAISSQDAITNNLQQAIDVINSLDDSDFKRKRYRRVLTRKINRVLRKVDRGWLNWALNILERQLVTRMDGCALRGAPDLVYSPGIKKDWIINCDAQNQVYPLIQGAIDLFN